VDNEGEMLEVLAAKRKSRKAALSILKRAIKFTVSRD
jgi:transposase-like protein